MRVREDVAGKLSLEVDDLGTGGRQRPEGKGPPAPYLEWVAGEVVVPRLAAGPLFSRLCRAAEAEAGVSCSC
jgi:hypothetical protein